VIEGAEVEICEVCLGNFEYKTPQGRPVKKREKRPERETEVVENLGEIVKQARESEGLSYAEFAKKVGIKEALLRRIEHGFIPDLGTVRKLERYLKKKLTYEIVIDEEEGPEKREEAYSLESISEIENDGS